VRREEGRGKSEEERLDVFAGVHADLEERNRKGWESYGGPLEAHNGRDPLREAYEEALDLAVYLRWALMERAGE
jgi:hypothetical protein